MSNVDYKSVKVVAVGEGEVKGPDGITRLIRAFYLSNDEVIRFIADDCPSTRTAEAFSSTYLNTGEANIFVCASARDMARMEAHPTFKKVLV